MPKIKDKKQSERLKEAARELGADEDSADAIRVLEQMLGSRVMTSFQPTGAEAMLVGFNRGGIAKLSDDTFWRVAGDGFGAARWIGHRVKVINVTMPNPAWTRALVNLETGERMAVVPTSARY